MEVVQFNSRDMCFLYYFVVVSLIVYIQPVGQQLQADR
jgi:hypothetical protein